MTDRELARTLAETARKLADLAATLAEREPRPDIKPVSTVATPDGDRLLTGEEVALRLGLDVAAVARRKFPFRIKVGRRTVRYSAEGLRIWTQAKRMATGG